MSDLDSSISSTEDVENINQEEFDSDSTIIIETNLESFSNKYNLSQDIKQFTENERDVNNLLKSNDVFSVSSQILNKSVMPITYCENGLLKKNSSSFVCKSSINDDIQLDVDAIIKKYTSTSDTLTSPNSEYNQVSNNNCEPIEISSDEDDLPQIKVRSVAFVLPNNEDSHDKKDKEKCSSNDDFDTQMNSFKSASLQFKETETLINTELSENLPSTSGTLSSTTSSFNSNDIFTSDFNDEDLFTKYDGIRCDSDIENEILNLTEGKCKIKS